MSSNTIIDVFAMARRGVARIGVSVPPCLLDEFDEVINRLGHNRSKAIQVAMRDFLTEYMWRIEVKGIGVGALTMIYNHETGGFEETLTKIEHEYRDMISLTTHVHLDERNCLEILAVRGEVDSIQSLAKRLMAERGVKQLKLATVMLQRP